jgi:hypothetical protein
MLSEKYKLDPNLSTGKRHFANTPLAVALFTGVYFSIVLIFNLSLNDWKALHFVHEGINFVNRSTVSTVIKLDPTNTRDNGGYDGQFNYYMAVDPPNAVLYIDNPSYRYSRILYIAISYALALGKIEWVPWTMLLVNLIAVMLTAWLLGWWCVAHKFSAWLALGYTFSIGLLLSVDHDLTEPLAYMLVAASIVLFRLKGYIYLAALCLGLAAITREVSLLFGLPYLLVLLRQPNLPLNQRFLRTALSVLLMGGPYVLWESFLRVWLGTWGFLSSPNSFTLVPLGGYFRVFDGQGFYVIIALVAIVPSLLLLGLAVWTLLRTRTNQAELWALILNVIVLVIFLPKESYEDLIGTGRINLGVITAAFFTLPYLVDLKLKLEPKADPSQAVTTPKQTLPVPLWFLICALLWCFFTFVLFLTNPTPPYNLPSNL